MSRLNFCRIVYYVKKNNRNPKNKIFYRKRKLLLKIMKISFLLVILKLLINNFYVPEEFFWNRFDFNFKEREYFLEWEDGCKIIEIGKRDKYYYGRVISGGITLYKPGEYDYSKCEDEYFLIDDSNGLDRNIYYKNKEDILKVIKKYKTKEPYKFFMFSILG